MTDEQYGYVVIPPDALNYILHRLPEGVSFDHRGAPATSAFALDDEEILPTHGVMAEFRGSFEMLEAFAGELSTNSLVLNISDEPLDNP